MGSQKLTVQLFNENFGTITIDENEPEGLSTFSITRERKRGASGFVFEFSLSLGFIKEARAFIKDVFEAQGTDGIIGINVFSYNPNTYQNEVEYQGQLQLDNYTIDQDQVTTNVEPIGFERKFLNLEKRDVDMTSTTSRLGNGIGAANLINIPLAPRTIKKQAFLAGSEEFYESGLVGGIGSGFNVISRFGSNINESDFDNTFIEIDAFISPNDVNETPVDTKNFILKVTEAGNYEFDFSNFTFDISIETGNSDIDSMRTRVFFAIVNPNDPNFTTQTLFDLTLLRNEFDLRQIPSPGNRTILYQDYNHTLNTSIINQNLSVGTEVYFWIRYEIDFELAGDSDRNVGYRIQNGAEFRFKANTVFPETSCNGYLVYEFLQQIVRFYTDQVDCFRSDFFGRTDTEVVYSQDGPGSLLFITNGRAIRQLDEQTIFGKWEEAFQSLTALYCLGWGFEQLPDGTRIVRVEPKDYFYNRDLKAIELRNLTGLKKFVEFEMLYSQVKGGYPKLENLNQVNGTDEFNTQRTWASPLTNATEELDITSVYRAAGSEIERQRRLVGKTDDSKLDDENYFIEVLRDALTFRVKQGADWEFVNNVVDPETVYNVGISPARNVDRWGIILASNVIRSMETEFPFSFGDYNYLMSSKDFGENEVFENGPINVAGVDPLFYPDVYEFESPLSKDDRQLINDNINGYLVGEDWDGIDFEGYFEKVRATIAERKGDFRILRLFR